MADDAKESRVFSEDELVAIASDRVARETAELTTKIEELTSEKTELANKLDTEIAAREAAEQRATAAEQKHQEYLEQLEAEKAAAARKDERLTKVREAASHLPETFLEDEQRVERIIAMDETHFEGYLSDLRDAAANAPSGESTPPRETAMAGSAVTPKSAESAPAARSFMMRTYVAPKEA